MTALILAVLLLAIRRPWRQPALPRPRTDAERAAAWQIAARAAAYAVHQEIGQARADLYIAWVHAGLYAPERDRVGLFTVAAMWRPWTTTARGRARVPERPLMGQPPAPVLIGAS